MEKYLAELLGTFILIFCGTGAVVIDNQRGGKIGHLGVVTTFGLVVCMLIYSFGSISGCHLNPAVSITMLYLGKLPITDFAPYLFAQFLGAWLGSFVLKILFPEEQNFGITTPSGTHIQSIIMEFIISFILMFSILRVFGEDKNLHPLGGIIIGFVVLFLALFAGPVSGASMNPARSFGPALVAKNAKSLWIYFVFPTLGMLVAAMVNKFLF